MIRQLQEEKKNKLLGVLVTDERKIRTKSGQAMSFLEISDESGEISAVVFPDVYRKYLRILKKGALVLLGGYLEYRKGRAQFVVQEAKALEELSRPGPEVQLFLRITAEKDRKEILMQVKNALFQQHGETKVVLFFEKTKKLIRLSDEYRVDLDGDVIEELRNILNPENVRIHSLRK